MASGNGSGTLVVTDYQIQANARRCAATGRELLPGEKYYTALFDDSGRFVRRDFCEDAWPGPPEGSFGFWSGRIPPAREPDRPTIDDDQLMDFFLQLEHQTEPARVKLRYVVALLLVRRKRLQLEIGQSDSHVLTLRCKRDRRIHDVVNPGLAEEDIAAVQQDVLQALGWE
jgi:hypothetical protein